MLLLHETACWMKFDMMHNNNNNNNCCKINFCIVFFFSLTENSSHGAAQSDLRYRSAEQADRSTAICTGLPAAKKNEFPEQMKSLQKLLTTQNHSPLCSVVSQFLGSTWGCEDNPEHETKLSWLCLW